MPHASHTFRIFVSSTFSDLDDERNALQQHVFPRLERLCLAHAMRLQAIDLRWGVREEAGLDQRTMRICLEELERCRRISPRPNFIVLLGDRYGWRPVPAVIPASEFEQLRLHVPPGPDAALLSMWYRRDDNAVPPEYHLKPRTVDTREGENHADDEAARASEVNTWTSVERSLRRILMVATARAAFSEQDRAKYEMSATEQEIQHGALGVSDAHEHVFCFFREITNLEDVVRDLAESLPAEVHARNFIDTGEDGLPDPDARERLSRVKASLRQRLANNVYPYRVRWMGRAGTSDTDIDAGPEAIVGMLDRKLREAQRQCSAVQPDDAAWARLQRVRDEELNRPGATVSVVRSFPAVITRDHLPALCADVFLALARVILSEIVRRGGPDPLDQDDDEHEVFGLERAHRFVGRADIRRNIMAYAVSSNAHPLAVHGVSGVGKSALMARASMDLRDALPHAVVVRRFIGATPGSPDIGTLIDGLTRQVSRAYGADETTIPADVRELMNDFPRRLALATSQRPLIIVIDALDQLSDTNHARSLTWLPAQLPPHVRVIVSTLPGECCTALERKLPAENLITLTPMPLNEASELLDVLLTSAARTLQPDQRREVLDRFARSAAASFSAEAGHDGGSGLPLFLKIAFEEILRWTSHGDYPPLGADVPGIIRDLFTRLSQSANHGAIAVSRSLAYLAAAKNGLSESELLDVLTLDPDVFGDFEERARHRPPSPRLPVVVWSRLFFDLKPYLMERAADGTSLLTFYHHQFREVVEQDYLTASLKTARHRALADYFGPRSNLFDDDGRAINVRKLSELPYQQTCAGLREELYRTLTDIGFLEAKCAHVGLLTWGTGPDAVRIHRGVHELQEDYRSALGLFVNADATGTPPGSSVFAEQRQTLRALQAAIRLSVRVLQYRPSELASQLTGRLANHRSEQLRRHVASARPAGRSAWLRPLTPALDVPTSGLLGAFQHPHHVDQSFLVRGDTALLNVGSPDAILWDIETGQELARIRDSVRVVGRVAFTPDVSHLLMTHATSTLFTPEPIIYLWQLKAGEKPRELRGHARRKEITHLATLGAECAISASRDQTLRIWDLESGDSRSVMPWRGDGHVVVSGDGRWLTASSNGPESLAIWEIGTFRRRCELAFPASVSAVDVVESSHIVVGTEQGSVYVADPVCGKDRLLGRHLGPVCAFRSARGGRLLVSLSKDGELICWDLESGRELVRAAGNAAREGRHALAVSDDGAWAAVAAKDDFVSLWDLGACQRIDIVKPGRPWNWALSSNARFAYADHQGLIEIRDLGRRRRPLVVKRNRHDIRQFGLSRDGRALLVGSTDHDHHWIDVWDIDAIAPPGEGPRAPASAIQCVVSSHDGKQVVTAAIDGTIKLLDPVSGECLKTLAGHTEAVNQVAVALDGTRIVSGSTERSVRCWTSGGEPLWITEADRDPMTPGSRIGLAVSAGFIGVVLLWCFSDSLALKLGLTVLYLVFGGIAAGAPGIDDITGLTPCMDGESFLHVARGGRLYVRSLTTGEARSGQHLWRLRLKVRKHAGYVPVEYRGSYLCRGELVLVTRTASSIGIWDVKRRTLVSALRGDKNWWPSVVALSEDGRWALSGARDELALWELRRDRGQRVWVLPGTRALTQFQGDAKGAKVTAAAITANGAVAVVGRDDGSLRVFDLRKHHEIAAFTADGAITACTFCADGRIIAAGDKLGSTHLLALETLEASGAIASGPSAPPPSRRRRSG